MLETRVFLFHFFIALVRSNFDKNSNPPEMIKKYGFPVEIHTVQTADGYLLQVHRIPYGKNGPGNKNRFPILLQHGFLSSSIDWVINGPEKSLGYRLSDAGYDVWMPNSRGNIYSLKHIEYDTTQPEFWDFTFHEMGYYDEPAIINHILNETKHDQIICVAHSLGNAIFYVMVSTRPEYNSKIKAQIGLAPAYTLSHTTSAIRLFTPLNDLLHSIPEAYRTEVFTPHGLFTQAFRFVLCNKNYFDYYLCEKAAIFALFGKDNHQFETSLLPIISNKFPSGTSLKTGFHCSQLISIGKFQQYDYGVVGNYEKYRSPVPPKYNISKITIPIRIYYGLNDILVDPLDIKLLYAKILKPMGLIKIDSESFMHVDFTWAVDVNRLINNELIEFIRNLTNPYTSSDFIQRVVENATDIRSKQSSPVDVSFDELKFTNTFRSFYSLLQTLWQ